MEAFTDYLFKALGDVPGKEAPVRAITVLAFDQDKCVTVRIEEPGLGQDYIFDVPARYIYTNRKSHFFAAPVSLDDLMELPIEPGIEFATIVTPS